MTPDDDLSHLQSYMQYAIREFYNRKMSPLPLHITCIDLTEDNDIVKNEQFMHMLDDDFISNSRMIDLPSLKITAKQAKYCKHSVQRRRTDEQSC